LPAYAKKYILLTKPSIFSNKKKEPSHPYDPYPSPSYTMTDPSTPFPANHCEITHNSHLSFQPLTREISWVVILPYGFFLLYQPLCQTITNSLTHTKKLVDQAFSLL